MTEPRSRIGGDLSLEALSRFHFHAMPPDQQAVAIRRMFAIGQGERTIAQATGLSIEAIQRIVSHGTSPCT